jgi:hypothetical protein
MASLLTDHVVASEVQVGTRLARTVLVKALKQQAERHFGRPYEVLELGPRAGTPLPTGQSGPKGGFMVEQLARDIEAHLVDQAPVAVRPRDRRGTLGFSVVSNDAKQETARGRKCGRPERRCAQGHSQLARRHCVVDVDVEVATGRPGIEALGPQVRTPFLRDEGGKLPSGPSCRRQRGSGQLLPKRTSRSERFGR